MAATYYLLLTEYGQAKIAALIAGETLELTDVAIGDADGQPYLPESRLDETDLVNERARVPVQSVAATGDVTTVIATIDSTIGGFNFHELAILDDTGKAVYLGNYHGQYKPVLTEGAGGEIELNLLLGTAGIGPVFLQVDPTIVTANKAWVIANFVRITTFDAYVLAEEEARVAGDTEALNNAKTYTDSVDLARAIDTLNKINVEAYIRDLADTNEANARYARDENLQAQINAFAENVYPRVVASGFATMDTEDVSGWRGSKTISSGGRDLTDTSKYILQFTLLGAGINSAADIVPSWSSIRTSANFTVKLKFNTDSTDFKDGTWDFTWSILQIAA